MVTSASSPGRRSSLALWAGLLVVAAAAWLLLIGQHPGMPAAMAGPWLVFGEFLLLWMVMMAAMMLPSVAPLAPMGTGMGMGPSTRTVWSAAVILAVAGLYQFSPVKARCLKHCRSPLGFLLHFGNYSGRLRDVRVGAYHGAYCVGCCWSLMLILV